jgi:SAM-dependent methyltransferase
MDREQIARLLVSVAGPGPVLSVGALDEALVRRLRLWGVDVRSVRDLRDAGGVSGTLLLAGEAIAASWNRFADLAALCRRLGARSLLLLPAHSPAPLAEESQWPGSLDAWTSALIAAGFRRHLRAFRPGVYQTLNQPGLPELTAFELLGEDVLRRYPVESLASARDLHMDMTREAGGRADAHLARYALASGCIRSGDTVLDCACGFGYGTALMRELSPGVRFIGVDSDPAAIEYARAVFGGVPGIEFHVADAARLEFLPGASIDFAASFETLEHLRDYDGFLRECRRVLKPDGRLLASVPNLWVNELGKDPNPHHFHVFDLARLNEAASRHFVVEGFFFQTAPGGMKHPRAQRDLFFASPAEAPALDPEWWIVMASRDPLAPEGAAFPGHPAHDAAAPGAVIFDYGGHYTNPWLQRSLVELPHRLAPEALLDVSRRLADSAPPGSPELGAALCVLGYELLRRGGAEALLGRIDEYLRAEHGNPHVLRWQVSLSFLAGRICLLDGRRAEAARFFEVCANLPYLRYSPTMGTKTCGACIHLALLALGGGGIDAATDWLRRGAEIARESLQSPWDNVTGAAAGGSPGQLIELAEIARMGDECLAALQSVRRGRAEAALLLDLLTSRFQGAVNVEDARRGEAELQQALHARKLESMRTLRDALLSASSWTDLPDLDSRTLKRRVIRLGEMKARGGTLAFQAQVRLERADGEWVRILSVGAEPPSSALWLCLNVPNGFFHLGTAAGEAGWRTVDSAHRLYSPGGEYSIAALVSAPTGELLLDVNGQRWRAALPEAPPRFSGAIEAGSEGAVMRFHRVRFYQSQSEST